MANLTVSQRLIWVVSAIFVGDTCSEAEVVYVFAGSPDCANLYEQFYASCHPRLEIFAPNAPIVPFLRLCQGLVPNWSESDSRIGSRMSRCLALSLDLTREVLHLTAPLWNH
jgi:hypothetical protein